MRLPSSPSSRTGAGAVTERTVAAPAAGTKAITTARASRRFTREDATAGLLAVGEAAVKKVPQRLPYVDANRRLREAREGPSPRRGPAHEAARRPGRLHRLARARLPEALRRRALRDDRQAARAAREWGGARRALVRGLCRRARGAVARVAAADVRRPDDGRDRPPRG